MSKTCRDSWWRFSPPQAINTGQSVFATQIESWRLGLGVELEGVSWTPASSAEWDSRYLRPFSVISCPKGHSKEMDVWLKLLIAAMDWLWVIPSPSVFRSLPHRFEPSPVSIHYDWLLQFLIFAIIVAIPVVPINYFLWLRPKIESTDGLIQNRWRCHRSFATDRVRKCSRAAYHDSADVLSWQWSWREKVLNDLVVSEWATESLVQLWEQHLDGLCWCGKLHLIQFWLSIWLRFRSDYISHCRPVSTCFFIGLLCVLAPRTCLGLSFQFTVRLSLPLFSVSFLSLCFSLFLSLCSSLFSMVDHPLVLLLCLPSPVLSILSFFVSFVYLFLFPLLFAILSSFVFPTSFPYVYSPPFSLLSRLLFVSLSPRFLVCLSSRLSIFGLCSIEQFVAVGSQCHLTITSSPDSWRLPDSMSFLRHKSPSSQLIMFSSQTSLAIEYRTISFFSRRSTSL